MLEGVDPVEGELGHQPARARRPRRPRRLPSSAGPRGPRPLPTSRGPPISARAYPARRGTTCASLAQGRPPASRALRRRAGSVWRAVIDLHTHSTASDGTDPPERDPRAGRGGRLPRRRAHRPRHPRRPRRRRARRADGARRRARPRLRGLLRVPGREHPRPRLLRRGRRGPAPGRAGRPPRGPGGPQPPARRPPGRARHPGHLRGGGGRGRRRGEPRAAPLRRAARATRARPSRSPTPSTAGSASGRPGLRPQGPDPPGRHRRRAPPARGGVRPRPSRWPSSSTRPSSTGAVGELAGAGFAGLEAYYARYRPEDRRALRRAGPAPRPGGDRRVRLPRDRQAGPVGRAPAAATSRSRTEALERAGRPPPLTGPASRALPQSGRDGAASRPASSTVELEGEERRRPTSLSPAGLARARSRRTPASAARSSSSAGRRVATQNRDGASENSGVRRPADATTRPTSDARAISARATPRPPAETSWTPSQQPVPAGHRLGHQPGDQLDRPRRARRGRGSAGRRPAGRAARPPSGCPRGRPDAARPPGCRRTTVDPAAQPDPGRPALQPVDEPEHADHRRRVDVPAAALVVEADVAADDREPEGAAGARPCPSIASESCHMTSGCSGLPKLRQLTTATGRAPTQARLATRLGQHHAPCRPGGRARTSAGWRRW